MKTKKTIVNEVINEAEQEQEQQEQERLDDFNDFDFSDNANIISVRLHRFAEGVNPTKQGFPPFLYEYSVNNLPTLQSISEQFGGGNYMLVIRYKTNDERRFTLEKKIFSIEGKRKQAAQEQQEVYPAPNPLRDNNLIDNIKLLKELGIIQNGNNGSSDLSLIIENIRATNSMILEIIKSQTKNNDNDTQKILLQKLLDTALQKNSGELEQFEKFITIWQKAENGSANNSELAWLKDLAPYFLPLLTQKKQQPQQTVINPQLQLSNKANIETNPILTELKKINDRLEKLENNFKIDYDLLDEIDYMIEQGKSKEEIFNYCLVNKHIKNENEFNEYLKLLEIENNNVKSNNINDTNMSLFNFNLDNFITGLKQADFNERVITLKQAMNLFTREQVFKFCLKNDIVKDLQEFNQYCEAANIPILETGE